MLGGTLSTRMYLKQSNHTVQKKLERYLEPIITHERLLGGAFDFKGYQHYLSRLLLENHPHDSICGCSVDELHDEMMTRFMCLEQLEDTLYDDTCLRLQQVDESPGCDAELMLFEPGQDGLPSYVEVEVQFDRIQKGQHLYVKCDYIELPGELPPLPTNVRAEDENGNPLKCTVLSMKQDTYIMHLQDFDQPQVYHANTVKLALWLPGMTYGTHLIRLYKDDTPIPAPTATSAEIENEFYKVSFDNDSATFTVTDHKSGKVHKGFHKFIDVGDAGDEYSYSWPDTDRLCTLEPDDVVEVCSKAITDFSFSLTVKGALKLPAKLTDDRKSRSNEIVNCPFVTTIKLYEGIDRIDIDTEIENHAEDHRLQVEFPAGSICPYSSGSAHFAVTEHSVEKPVPPTWEEYPLSTALTHGFADAGSEAYGLSLASDGMPEYEAANYDGESHLRLTLLRCVGWLSRPDLNSRTVNGGWEVETPGGQCKGKSRFSYSVVYRAESWRKAGTFGQMEHAIHPIRTTQILQPLKNYDNPLAFLSCLPPLIRLSAVKPSAEGNGIILRFYSLDQTEQLVRLPLPEAVESARLVTLAELPIEDLPMGADRMIEIPVRPGKIITLELFVK